MTAPIHVTAYCERCGEIMAQGAYRHHCPTLAEIWDTAKALRTGALAVTNRYGEPVRHQGPHGAVMASSDAEEKAWRAAQLQGDIDIESGDA